MNHQTIRIRGLRERFAHRFLGRCWESYDWALVVALVIVGLMAFVLIAAALDTSPPPADPCSWDPEVHVQHVYLTEIEAWACIPADQAG